MRNITIITLGIILASVLFIAGCVEPIEKLGCCLKKNISDGCVLYSADDLLLHDYIDATHWCNETSGYCNVTISSKDHIIPICTEDSLVPCIQPECTVMVCGDFTYTPRVAPAVITVDESAGDIPPDVDDAVANQFYKAQCRFFPMDVKLRQIMKNSKSQINVFRIGIGGSFDEFDQYKYYFPMSDKFCAVSSSQRSDIDKVDRYMNYLTPTNEEFNPVEEITENCIDDSHPIGPFGFSESGDIRSSTLVNLGGITYDPVVPDQSNYKFTHYGVVNNNAVWDETHDGYYRYDSLWIKQSNIYKELDTDYYKKELSIAYANRIYGEDEANSTRAPFECELGRSDCYSGECNAEIYNRGVLLENGSDENPGEIVADCKLIRDTNGFTKVVCAPTLSVFVDHPGEIPNIQYANVETILTHMESHSNPRYNYGTLIDDENALDVYWNGFDETTYVTGSMTSPEYEINNIPKDIGFYQTEKKNCIQDYGDNDDDNLVFCSTVIEADTGPPAGGIVFFGKINEDTVQYNGDTIIGYVIASPEDFENMMVVKNCGFDTELVTIFGPRATEIRAAYEADAATCTEACEDACSGDDSTEECNAYCTHVTRIAPCPAADDIPPAQSTVVDSPEMECQGDCLMVCGGAFNAECTDYCTGEGPVPCTPDTTALVNTKDYVKVDLTGPDDPYWNDLMIAFTPYFKNNVNGIIANGFEDGCGRSINSYDAVLSAMPWIVSFDKGIRRIDTQPDPHEWDILRQRNFLASYSAEMIRDTNTYDQPMETEPRDMSSCELRRYAINWENTISPPHSTPLDEYEADPIRYDLRPYYDVLFSKSIYLIKYEQGSRRIGNCAIDDNTYLPKMKTFGWCEPCTSSTLAFQEIKTEARVYMPDYQENIEETAGTDVQNLCEVRYGEDRVWRKRLGLWVYIKKYTDSVSCYNQENPDIKDYKDSLGIVGSPRTIPEASILKERMDNYMKSGIMPIFDLSDDSNWNTLNPDRGDSGGTDAPNNYREYDFQGLFGEMGAVTVVLEHVHGEADAEKIELISERAKIIRDNCYGCLTAFQVDDALSNQSFKESMESVFLGEPTLYYDIDLVTFNYNISDHPSILSGQKPLADDLVAYARVALKSKGKPTMVVGLNIDTEPGYDQQDYEDILIDIVVDQNDLINAGLIGIIYSPARSSGTNGPGIVSVDMLGVGDKGEKFCAMQTLMERMTASPPIALFTRTQAVESINCTKCTSFDVITGNCNLACENGIECTISDGAELGNYKCPSNTVVEPCQICSEIPGDYSCTLTYENGTVEPVNGHMSDLISGAYVDVIAGISAPNKCCLMDEGTGVKYTFVKQSSVSQINKPIVFPKSGDENSDCGLGIDISDLSEITEFCGTKTTIMADYDIECEID